MSSDHTCVHIGDVRQELANVAMLAEIELRRPENVAKGGWEKCSLDWLIARAHQELDEVSQALEAGKDIGDEVGDVVAFMAMIYDNWVKAGRSPRTFDAG
jgi:hypothetical protein